MCTRCGRRPAFLETDWLRITEEGGPPQPPPIPPGLCLACGLDDPELAGPIRAWFKELEPWADQQMQGYFRKLREWVARPLEAIDRFVDSLR
jgi:hypothetical protein